MNAAGKISLWRAVRALLAIEARQMSRSLRFLVFALLLPLLVWPLSLWLGARGADRQQERLQSARLRYALDGPEAAAAGRLLASLADAEAFVHEAVPEGEQALADGAIELAIHADAADGAKADDEPFPAASATLHLEIAFRADRDLSRHAATTLESRLLAARERRREAALRGAGIELPPQGLWPVELHDVASAAERSGLRSSRFLTPLLVFFLVIGSSLIAGDAIAGEKERGTLQTLLTTSLSRRALIIAKALLILLVGLTIALLQITFLAVTAATGRLAAQTDLSASEILSRSLLLLAILLPIALVAAAFLLLASTIAHSYKQAQLFHLPVLAFTVGPTLVTLVPGLDLRSAWLLVPISNLALAAKSTLSGRLDAVALIVAWVSTSAFGLLLLAATSRLLSDEDRLMPSRRQPSSAAALRLPPPAELGQWFAILWAVLLLVALRLGSSLTAQIAVNFSLFAVFLALAAWRFGTPARRLFRLRAPSLLGLAAAFIGAPSGLLLTNGLAPLLDRILPMPEALLEEFRAVLMPEAVPVPLLLLLVALLPGVVEELLFRGLLLSSLEERFRPWVAIAVSAGAFAIFHFSIYRLVPTLMLGLLFGMAAYASASIIPAMLWHTLNNGLAVALRDLEPTMLSPIWTAVGAAGVAVASGLLVLDLGRRRRATSTAGE